MARQTRPQKKVVGRVMREYKQGELKSSTGGKVKKRKQAIAIALSESGQSRRQSPAEKRRSLARTKTREAKGMTGKARRKTPASSRRATSTAATRSSAIRSRRSGVVTGKTKGELYAEARRRDIPGRSRMTKAQLARAVASH